MLSFGVIALAGCGGGGGGGGGGAAALGATAAANAAASQSNSSDGGVSSGGTVLGTTPQTVTFCGSQSDIVDSSLNIVASQYTSTASQMSKDAGIAYRYGPDAIACGTSGTGVALAKRTDTKLAAPAPDYPFWWQIGQVSGNAGSYSSNQGSITFVADNTAQRVGVADIQVSNHMYGVFAQSPQLSWTRAAVAGGGIDSVNVMGYREKNIVSSDPVAVGRCVGGSGFCSEGLVVFQNGVIGTIGSNTARNPATVQLPANKVPTAIAMTNDSEFALVTVWDTQALKGQVAVIALAGLCDGCDPYDRTGASNGGHASWYNWWQEWMGVYPGLANMGNIAFMKILGYVDLPGMAAPTEIAVTTGMDQFKTLYQTGSQVGQFVGYDSSPLTTTANWQKFVSGGANYYNYAKGGVAVVISKSEQKAAFIDLKPLFSYFNGMYFSSNVSQTTNFGQAANQWPFTFDVQASQKPTVVKTVSLGARPTAVKTTISERYATRAWIATQDGTLRIFSLDGFAPGDGWAMTANPPASNIAQVGTVTGIGRNPTSLANSKDDPTNPSGNQQVIVASRGDNKINWVRFASNGNSGSIVRTIQHNEIKDLIAVEDADNFSNQGYVMSALDYAGKAVRNYRYGPVIFSDGGACPAPNGCPVNAINGAAVEYGGAMALPGKPFQMNSANVP